MNKCAIIGIVIAFIVICALIFYLLYKLVKQSQEEKKILKLLNSEKPLASFPEMLQLAKSLESVTVFYTNFESLSYCCCNMSCVICGILKSCVVDDKTKKTIGRLEREVIFCRNALVLVETRMLECPLPEEELCELLVAVSEKLECTLDEMMNIFVNTCAAPGQEKIFAANCAGFLNDRTTLQKVRNLCESIVNGSVEQSNSKLDVNGLRCVGNSSERSQ
ncbi:hypothetical protein [Ehrlichia canis]|uniref:hypothetical protein n=1 Tax=Ehrlichia canis TaxID=944 RepID=UPI000C83C959|nr:hypothetical protein [Ehrlichia canis]AUO54519.1 hypothetical protein C1I72_01190 [Ehrlichia canis]UKC53531.1 hypothetical protein s20019040002_000574 [Ehrlichia canis]UKC54469.1 hypothetical protein s20026770001_000575 [Ehrlichia canis]UKC55405.1 hypothetical protein s21009500007_000575 [Ehrlichia canis]